MKRLLLSALLAFSLTFTPAPAQIPLLGVQQAEAGIVKKVFVTTAVGAAIRYGGRLAIRKVVDLAKDPALRKVALQEAIEFAIAHPDLMAPAQSLLTALGVQHSIDQIVRFARENRLDFAAVADVIDLAPPQVPTGTDLPGLAGDIATAGQDVVGLTMPQPAGFDTWMAPPAPVAPDVMAPLPENMGSSREGGLFDAMFGNVETQAPERDQGFFDPRKMRDDVVDVWGVDGSSTMPMGGYPTNPRQITGTDVVIARDKRGFPIFDNHVIDTAYIHLSGDRDEDNLRATADLRRRLEAGLVDGGVLNEEQRDAILAGEELIPDMVWHHHQDCGKMQLVPRAIHKLYHRGGFSLCEPE